MTEETKWFYLSFADPKRPEGTQFLGGCLVRAADMITAVQVAHALGINPGGEVMGHPVGASGMARAHAVGYPLEKLLTKSELEDLDSRMLTLPA